MMNDDESGAKINEQAYWWNLNPHTKRDSFLNCSSNLSFDVKRTALEASAGVVGILSHLGERKVVYGSGFVVESVLEDGKFISTVLTSASILRPEPYINEVADKIKISVILFSDITCEGHVFGWDFHYNLGVIKIETNVPVPSTRLRLINDSISVDPNLMNALPPKFHPESDRYNLVPGDLVIALGRYHINGSGLMVVGGKFSANRTDVTELDCQELLRAEFKIPTHGIGGPLINCDGEVIGMNFVLTDFTPFLPINIVSMWWERFKKNGHCLVPEIGLALSNLYTLQANDLEKLIQKFPDTFEGVVVDEPLEEFCLKSEPCSAKSHDWLKPGDVIIRCNEKPVRSILELFGVIWDEVGQSVQFEVLRHANGSRCDVNVTIVAPSQFNKWPLPLPQTRKRTRGRPSDELSIAVKKKK